MTDLSPKQLRVVDMLATGCAVKDAAEDVGVRPETVSRWKQEPAFQAAVDERISAAQEEIHRWLLDLTEKSMMVIDDTLSFGSPAMKLRAAFKVLDLVGAKQLNAQLNKQKST